MVLLFYLMHLERGMSQKKKGITGQEGGLLCLYGHSGHHANANKRQSRSQRLSACMR